MVTKTTATPAHNIPDLPASWGDADVLAGLSLIDKDELVGRPFLVRAVEQSFAAAGYPQCRVEFELTDGTAGMFQDSSATQGVRAEIEEILSKLGKADLVDEWIPVKFICPDGLRKSSYEKEDNRGVMRPGRNYYLTRSGKRADA